MLALLDTTSLAVLSAAMGTGAAVLTAAVIGIRYTIDASRLPAAVRDAELVRRVGANEDRLRDLEEQIREREVTLAERDQAEAEAEHWRTLVETQKAEYANLEAQRQEIEVVREEFRQAVEDLNAKETELRKAGQEIAGVKENMEAAEARKRKAEERLAEIEDKEREAMDLEARLEALREEKTLLAGELEAQRERVSALTTEEEALGRETTRLADRKEILEENIETIQQSIESLEPKRVEAEALLEEYKALKSRKTQAEEGIESLEAKARRLEAHIARLHEEADVEVDGRTADDRVLGDLRRAPACLYNQETEEPIWPDQLPAENENDALARVGRLLDESGLVFPRRTIKAFHTSLKTAVVSPLTVLAGISGTGKSQLPRRYADAMGMHFLKIPVQPRWDGPQDLFGFYNYIEKRYKATDLARALVHMDPHNWPEEAQPYENRILLVLLDEMNLARVEYYFSEFLSRLEGRPTDEHAISDQERRPSEIDIDVARNSQPMRVYAGQNILFVGTMNEDESTLALSDKVMDRANILRFPRPSELREELPEMRANAIADGYLDKDRWTRRWMREASSLDGATRSRATGLIEQINAVMDELGRPFGHRMSQAMLHYVANYPSRETQFLNSEPVNNGLADQIEQRIMPKLRGVDVVSAREPLFKLADIAGDKLRDSQLGMAIEDTLRRSENSIGIFNWRGFQRTEG